LCLLPLLARNKRTHPNVNIHYPQGEEYLSTPQSERYSPLKSSPSVPTAACVNVLDPCSAVRASKRIIVLNAHESLSLESSVLHNPGLTLLSTPAFNSGGLP
jgi:hypothetical protein